MKLGGDTLRTLEARKGDPITAQRHNDLIRRVADMFLEKAPSRRPAASSAVARPFKIAKTAALEVTVTKGTVTWHNTTVQFSGDVDQVVTIPSTSGTYRIWISLNDEFTPTSISIPTPAIAGWSSYPAQPTPPARKHFLLGTATVASVDSQQVITTTTQSWWGGDIVWPSIISMYS